jgi:hypothetical protein
MSTFDFSFPILFLSYEIWKQHGNSWEVLQNPTNLYTSSWHVPSNHRNLQLETKIICHVVSPDSRLAIRVALVKHVLVGPTLRVPGKTKANLDPPMRSARNEILSELWPKQHPHTLHTEYTGLHRVFFCASLIKTVQRIQYNGLIF